MLTLHLAASTRLLTGGKQLAEIHPALGNARKKRDQLRERKLKNHPDGLGIGGN